jgi:membrane protease YdiL (CAAX protease family)
VYSRTRPLLTFVAIAYALSIALSLVVGLTGGYQSPLIGLRYLSMFLPAIAVLIVSLTMNEQPHHDTNPFPWRYVPVALFLIPAVLHAAMLPAMVVLQGSIGWQDWLTPQADGLYHTPDSRGWGTLTLTGLAGRIALNAVVGLVVVTFLAYFEEIGWRAWLLPRLEDRMGARRAVVVTAIIWGFWHVPFQLSGIQHIDGVSPLRLALGLPFGIMATGLVIGWLWLRTENVWLVTIAHGALNNWGQYAFKYMKDPEGPHIAAVIARDLQVAAVGSLALLVVGTILLATTKTRGCGSSDPPCRPSEAARDRKGL